MARLASPSHNLAAMPGTTAGNSQIKSAPTRTLTTESAPDMDLTLTLHDVADDAIRKAIVAPLIEYNTAQAGSGNGRPLVVQIADASGTVVGGLWGHTGYDWLFTQLLVVPSNQRGTGIGRRIMDMAEQEAIARGCHGAWLDTFEFQARGFYERIGYSCFAELPEFPKGYSRYFMKKQLVHGQGANP